MKIVSILDKSNYKSALKEASYVLSNGGLVVYPTETCYGLGADALNQRGVDKLLSYKRRREGKPLSILVQDQDEASRYVDVNESAARMYERFLPGPVTVVSYVKKDTGAIIANGVASELGTIGIRISSHPFAMQLAQSYPNPITATSANASWKKKPYSVDDILSPLSNRQKETIDLILDAGNLPKRESSTVVDTTLVGGMVLRSGDLKMEGVGEEIVTKSPDETQDLARRLMLKYWNDLRKRGLVFALAGDLGVGKTVFAQGVGSFLEIVQPIVSPSYTLENEYDFIRHGVSGRFYHLDPWRLSTVDELFGLGFEKMLAVNHVVVIEWANKFRKEVEDLCNEKKVKLVVLSIEDQGDNNRLIRFR